MNKTYQLNSCKPQPHVMKLNSGLDCLRQTGYARGFAVDRKVVLSPPVTSIPRNLITFTRQTARKQPENLPMILKRNIHNPMTNPTSPTNSHQPLIFTNQHAPIPSVHQPGSSAARGVRTRNRCASRGFSRENSNNPTVQEQTQNMAQFFSQFSGTSPIESPPALSPIMTVGARDRLLSRGGTRAGTKRRKLVTTIHDEEESYIRQS